MDLDLKLLKNIFGYLEFADLLNVADSSKHLNEAACSIFQEKYQEKPVFFSDLRITQNHLLRIQDDIEIGDIKTSLQTLRCFGRFINEIIFNLLQTPTETSHLIELKKRIFFYINEFCSESLVNIEINRCPSGGLSQFKKPFAKVEKLGIANCYMPDNDNDWLIKTFPNIQAFGFKYRFFGSSPPPPLHEISKCFENNFPELKLLDIEVGNIRGSSSEKALSRDNFESLLRLNPQLRNLRFRIAGYPYLSAKILHNVKDSLQNLRKLSLVLPESNFLDDFDINENILYFKNVKHFELTQSSSMTSEILMPFLFDNLETFSLIPCGDPFSEDLYHFIERHPTIMKISIMGQSIDLNINRVDATVPSIEELTQYLEI